LVGKAKMEGKVGKKNPRKNNNKSKVKVGEKTRGKALVKSQHQKV